MLDRRADGRPSVRVQFCDCLGQQMGAGVAEDVEAGLGSAVYRLDTAVRLKNM